jgi:hypothetical protein
VSGVRAGRLLAQPAADPGQQLGQRERLGQVVGRPRLQAAHPGLDPGERGQHQDAPARVLGQQLAQHLDPGHARQHQVEHDQVVRLAAGRAQRGGTGRHVVDLVPAAAQRPAEEAADPLLVVDHQDARHRE